MNKYIKLAVCLITVAFCFTSCGNFDEINTDPDVPTRVTAAMLASGGIKSMLGSPGAKDFVQNNLACKHIAWGENSQGYLYNSFGRPKRIQYDYQYGEDGGTGSRARSECLFRSRSVYQSL